MSTVTYADTSALVKLVIAEPESPQLRAVVAGRLLAVSELALTELPRVLSRRLPAAQVRGPLSALVASLEILVLDRTLLDLAGSLEPAELGSIDAIHLASALRVGARLDQVLTYDRQLGRAAADHQLTVVAPGWP